MKTFTNSFSFNRFKSVFCWLLAQNKKSIIKMLIGTTLATFLFESIMLMWQIPFDVTVSVLALVFVIGTLVLAANYLSSTIDNKNNRIQFISMPANIREKFIASLSLFYFKVVSVIIAISLGDFLRYVISGMENGLMFNYLQGSSDNVQLWFGICLILALWSLVMVYSTNYPKSYGLIMLFCSLSFLNISMLKNIPAVIETHSLFSILPQDYIGSAGIIVCSLIIWLFFIFGHHSFMGIKKSLD